MGDGEAPWGKPSAGTVPLPFAWDVNHVPKIIDRFQGEYRFLSNFYVEPDGSFVEREYQAAKAVNPIDRSWILGMPRPIDAKRAGRVVELRADWDTIRLGVMFTYVRAKFMDHPTLRTKLLATGDAELIEGNTWGDRFWGVCRGVGENYLGRILMDVREELRG